MNIAIRPFFGTFWTKKPQIFEKKNLLWMDFFETFKRTPWDIVIQKLPDLKWS